MLKNTIINRKTIQKIAEALGPLNREVVFMGGAIISFYINDPAAEDIRPTKDIDISLSVHSFAALESFRKKLIQLGFVQSADLDVICRFKYEDILVDVMRIHRKLAGHRPTDGSRPALKRCRLYQ